MNTVRGIGTGLIADFALGAALIACGGSGLGPSPTPAVATPAATVAPPTATVAPPTVAPDPTFTGQVVEIVAKDRVFSVSTFDVEAGKPFEIRFENQDPYNHAFYIVAGDAYPADLSDQGLLHVAFRGDYFAGPGTMTHHVAALPAGIYTFLCPPHRPMEGTIIVR